jgi:hypothetical protein
MQTVPNNLWELVASLDEGLVFAVLFFAMAGLVAIVTTMFATIYGMHKSRLEDSLKRELLDRGMTADEIVAVIRAKPTKSHTDPNEI